MTWPIAGLLVSCVALCGALMALGLSVFAQTRWGALQRLRDPDEYLQVATRAAFIGLAVAWGTIVVSVVA